MSSSSVPGTNVAPISFPGIVSGIDYNSIISKLTSLTLAPTNALNAQLTTLNSANLELITINNLLSSVQNAIAGLSNPALYSSYDATSSNPTLATAHGITGVVASPGTYVIESASIASATTITSSTTAGHKETDVLTSGTYSGLTSDNAPLAFSYAAVTPSNGTGSSGQGSITVDGVQVQYNVNSQSLQTIFTNINNAVTTTAGGTDPSFHIGFKAGTDTIQITGSIPVTLGSGSDQGNLLQVLKLDQAQVNSTTVTGTSGVGGLNQAAPLNTGNRANAVTPITSGVVTINGVKITIDATGDNIASILTKINTSSAGVTASYNASTNQISLVNNTTGPQSIVLGASGDTSNFLAAVGLTGASGATTSVGKQAVLTVQNASGALQTVYSGSNAITNAVPGIEIDLTSAITAPVSITVAKDTTNLVTAVTTFISAYNAAIGEINSATAAPVVSPISAGQLSRGGTSQTFGGGVLYGNSNVQSLRFQLANIVGGTVGSYSDGAFQSLANLGITLDNTFSTLTTSNNGTNNGGTPSAGSSGALVQNTTYQGTDGQLQVFNPTKLLAALTSNPNAVQDAFNGPNGLTHQLGVYLTSVTGAPTLLFSGPVGNIPTTSILQGFENANTDTIHNVQAQVKQITNNANLQANNLRAQFLASESLISQLQSEQQQLASALGFTVSSGSSSA